MKHLNQVLSWFGFEWVDEASGANHNEASQEQVSQSSEMPNKQQAVAALVQVLSVKLQQDLQESSGQPEPACWDIGALSSRQDTHEQDALEYVQLPSLNLPEAFVDGLSRYLLGYPQHVKSLFYFELLQGESAQLYLGLLASDRAHKAGVASENEINPDWLAVAFVPYLEGLLEQHLEDFSGELHLVLLDEQPSLMGKVLHRIQPLYQSQI